MLVNLDCAKLFVGSKIKGHLALGFAVAMNLLRQLHQKDRVSDAHLGQSANFIHTQRRKLSVRHGTHVNRNVVQH